MQRSAQGPDCDEEGRDLRHMDFAGYCARCFRELRAARLGRREEDWRSRLAWHCTRFGALLTADAEFDKRIATIVAGWPSVGSADIRAARADALLGEAARRSALTADERRVEAATRRRLAATNLAELREGSRT